MSFKIGGCLIKLDLLFFAALALGFCCDESGWLGLTLVCAALHEAGHIFAMLLCGARPAQIALEPFGACISCPESIFLRTKLQIVIHLAGVFTNFVLAAFSYAIFGFCPLFWVNTALGVFNLLPIAPLDGANALECSALACFGEKTAILLKKIISAVFLLPLGVWGFAVTINNKNSYSSLFICLYLCGVFLADCGGIQLAKGNKKCILKKWKSFCLKRKNREDTSAVSRER